jgi:hypothetical protein
VNYELLPLPMTPATLTDKVMAPALALLPDKMTSDAARVMLIAIALQESGLAHRQQVGGPARGLWQFERGGGVRGVLTHPASRDYADRICRQRGIQPAPSPVYAALDQDDILACCMARLLLWTDPKALPVAGQCVASWGLYARVWRPGKPRPDDWPENYQTAVEAL